MSDSPARAFAILLDSPMQSWGSSSRFTRRETEAFPTKSALVGLLAAAAGIDKHAPGEAEKLARFSDLTLTVYRLPRAGRRLVQRLSDFHTVGGGYDARASAFDKLSKPRKASGGISADAVITHRTYLTDARFIAGFEGDPGTIADAVRHLDNPVWGVWFGRKNCVPAMPLSPTPAADRTTAVRALLDHLRHWEERTRPGDPPGDFAPDHLERWEEPEGGGTAAGDFHLHDKPLGFGSREFHTRPVRRIPASEP